MDIKTIVNLLSFMVEVSCVGTGYTIKKHFKEFKIEALIFNLCSL